jgi:PDZ domain-containing protein
MFWRSDRGEGAPRVTWGQAGTALLVLVAVAVVILEIIPAHQYALAPGSALPVASKVNVQGYPPVNGRGTLYMVDVSVIPVDHLLEEIYWKLQPDVELDPAQTVAGNLSYHQYIQLNQEMMSDSVHKSEVAALEAARGYKLHFKKGGPLVVFVDPSLPASHFLKPGDTITAVDGHRVNSAEDLSRLVKRHHPGQKVRISVQRGGRSHTFDIPTVGSVNGVPKKGGKTALIGVASENRIALPVKISINPGNIGGPSAGLMFSLAIIQQLQHRDLARGCKVAGTGEIDWNGHVLPIGGARQKVVAAENAGAKYFLVPNTPDNVGPARAGAHSIKVVPVSSLRQALTFLNSLTPCR